MTDMYSSKHLKTSMPKNFWYLTLAEVKKNQLNAEALRLYGPIVQSTSGLVLL